jgi:hypothetical protein
MLVTDSSLKEVEQWLIKHSARGNYFTSPKLSPPGSDCWYCSKQDAEQARLLLDYDHFPFHTAAAADGKSWLLLEERWQQQ